MGFSKLTFDMFQMSDKTIFYFIGKELLCRKGSSYHLAPLNRLDRTPLWWRDGTLKKESILVNNINIISLSKFFFYVR